MRIHLMAAVAAVGLLAGTAWAGGDKSAASQSSPAASTAAQSSGSSSASGAMMTQAELQQQLGKDVSTKSGETIGRLDDIVLDAGGKPQKAIIALTDSSKNVAVPFSDLQQDSDGWALKTQTKQQLTAMSSYQQDPSTVSLNHPRGSSGSSSSGRSSDLPSSPTASPSSPSSSSTPSSRSLDNATSPSSSLPSGSTASPSAPSSRTQP